MNFPFNARKATQVAALIIKKEGGLDQHHEVGQADLLA
jgi:hypothetical protein